MYRKVGLSVEQLKYLESQKKKEIEEKVRGWIWKPYENCQIAGNPGVEKSIDNKTVS